MSRDFDNNNTSCLQEVHGRDEYFQVFQVLAHRFRLFGTFFRDDEIEGGSAICIHRVVLPEGAMVTHVGTCQGRNHLLNVRTGQHGLVIVCLFRT